MLWFDYWRPVNPLSWDELLRVLVKHSGKAGMGSTKAMTKKLFQMAWSDEIPYLNNMCCVISMKLD